MERAPETASYSIVSLDGAQEPDRLRALLTLMREFGVTRIATPDGFILERPAPSPFEASVGVTQASAKASKGEDDDESTDADDAREKNLERQWTEVWRKQTVASGASVPPYPGPEKAARFLARWA